MERLHDGRSFAYAGICLYCPAGTGRGLDLNGESGEYHTFCYGGSIFQYPIPFRQGELFLQSCDIRLGNGPVKTYFCWFADLKE